MRGIRIATDPNYSRDKVIEASAKVGPAYKEPIAVSYTINAIEILLFKISKTSPGFDNIPYTVYRDCAGELAFVVTKIINMSIGTGVVPAAWRTAIITPVPKCSPVT